jgi:hypothetical protein
MEIFRTWLLHRAVYLLSICDEELIIHQ